MSDDKGAVLSLLPTGKIVGKKELAKILGWSRPKLDRRLRRDANFPIVERGNQREHWSFDVVAVRAHVGELSSPEANARPTSSLPPAPIKLPHIEVVTEIGGQQIAIHGREARVLLALIAAGPRGCSREGTGLVDEMSIGVRRLRARGFDVPMEREQCQGVWRARYRLRTPVRCAVDYGGL